MRDITGVQHEVGRAGLGAVHGVDLVEGELEGRCDVLVGRLVEPDMTIADLHEAEGAGVFRWSVDAILRGGEEA